MVQNTHVIIEFDLSISEKASRVYFVDKTFIRFDWRLTRRFRDLFLNLMNQIEKIHKELIVLQITELFIYFWLQIVIYKSVFCLRKIFIVLTWTCYKLYRFRSFDPICWRIGSIVWFRKCQICVFLKKKFRHFEFWISLLMTSNSNFNLMFEFWSSKNWKTISSKFWNSFNLWSRIYNFFELMNFWYSNKFKT